MVIRTGVCTTISKSKVIFFPIKKQIFFQTKVNLFQSILVFFFLIYRQYRNQSCFTQFSCSKDRLRRESQDAVLIPVSKNALSLIISNLNIFWKLVEVLNVINDIMTSYYQPLQVKILSLTPTNCFELFSD